MKTVYAVLVNGNVVGYFEDVNLTESEIHKIVDEKGLKGVLTGIKNSRDINLKKFKLKIIEAQLI